MVSSLMHFSRLFILIFTLAIANVSASAARSRCAKVFANGRPALEINHGESQAVGLVPEPTFANTVIIGFQSGMYHKTLLELLAKIDPNTQVILVVVENIRANELLQEFKATRRNLVIIRTKNYQGNVWVRDWLPQKVVRQDGSIEYVSLTYYAVNNCHQAATQFAQILRLPHYQSWVIGEMGNILVDGQRRLFTTRKIIEQNLSKTVSHSMIIDELKRAFAVDKVYIFPEHPRDGGIGHVDLMAKYLGRIAGHETVAVSDSSSTKVKVVLDKVAATFAALKFKVVRIMEYEGLTIKRDSGFVNSLLFNNSVFMPIYSRGLESSADQLLRLESNARAIYEGLGFQVIDIDANLPMRRGGAVHCLTGSGDFLLGL